MTDRKKTGKRRTRNKTEQFINRWKTDYESKTFVTAALSLTVTAVFAIYNGFLGIRHASLWHGTICVYYIVLTLLRGLIIIAAKRLSRRERKEEARNRICLAASCLLLLLNACLVVPLYLMVRQKTPVSLTLIPAIAMAAYTTFRIVMTSMHLKRRKASQDCLVRLLRTINFIDALVAVLTLQNTLIMVNGGDGIQKMLPLTAATSGAVWLAILILSVSAIVNGIRQLN